MGELSRTYSNTRAYYSKLQQRFIAREEYLEEMVELTNKIQNTIDNIINN